MSAQIEFEAEALVDSLPDRRSVLAAKLHSYPTTITHYEAVEFAIMCVEETFSYTQPSYKSLSDLNAAKAWLANPTTANMRRLRDPHVDTHARFVQAAYGTSTTADDSVKRLHEIILRSYMLNSWYQLTLRVEDTAIAAGQFYRAKNTAYVTDALDRCASAGLC